MTAYEFKPVYRMMMIRSDKLITHNAFIKDDGAKIKTKPKSKSKKEGYQRPIEKNAIQSIVADFDPRVVNEPRVSFRNGQYYIIDGQHTVSSLVKLNNNEPLFIPCKVFDDMNVKDEARLYAKQSGYARCLTPADKMRALLFADDELLASFKNAAESAGFTLALDGSSDSPGQIHCLNTALKLYRKVGEDVYRESMYVLGESWNGKKTSLKADIITGIVEFMRLYHKDINRYRLISRLKETDPVMLRRAILTDFDYPEGKRALHQIYLLYCGSSEQYYLPMRY